VGVECQIDRAAPCVGTDYQSLSSVAVYVIDTVLRVDSPARNKENLAIGCQYESKNLHRDCYEYNTTSSADRNKQRATPA